MEGAAPTLTHWSVAIFTSALSPTTTLELFEKGTGWHYPHYLPTAGVHRKALGAVLQKSMYPKAVSLSYLEGSTPVPVGS